MAFPTTSRATLRRAICSELGMEFARRYGGTGYLNPDAGSTAGKLVDAALTQPQDFWKNQWVYFSGDSAVSPSAVVGEVRQIISFNNSENACVLERDASAIPATTVQYEIHDIWNATEIHNAINRAIRDAIPNFFDIVTDETLVLKEDTLEYSLSGLTLRPWIISEIYIERPYGSMTGQVESSTNDTLTDSDADFSGVNANYKVSIYDGTNAGKVYDVLSGTSSGVLTLDSDTWDTNPDTTSKYRVWDPTDQRDEWFQVTSVDLNNMEYPDTIRFRNPYERLWGARIRLVYSTDPLELTTDASTTIVPQEFVIYKAISYLAGSRTWGRTADREKYAVLEQTMNAKAEAFRNKMAFRMDTTLWQGVDVSNPGTRTLDGNPLGW